MAKSRLSTIARFETFVRTTDVVLVSQVQDLQKIQVFKCSKGHRFQKTPEYFRKNQTCPKCRHLDYVHKSLIEKAKQRGYRILSIQYGSNRHDHRFNYVCPKGHHGAMFFHSFLTKRVNNHCCPKGHAEHRRAESKKRVLDILKSKSYSLIKYDHANYCVKVRCDVGREYETNVTRILFNCNCPKCSKHFRHDKPALLYYVRFDRNGRRFYKIGITNNSIKNRFCGEYPYKVLISLRFDTGNQAAELEKHILKTFKRYRYKGDRILKRSSNREVFIKDVLGIDKDDINTEGLGLITSLTT